MSSKVLTVDELVAEMLAKYKSSRRIGVSTIGPGSQLRRSDMSPLWQHHCIHFTDAYSKRLHDLFVTICKAEGDAEFNPPLPITEDRFGRAKRHLEDAGREAKNRAADWETALRALPESNRADILGPGPNPWLYRPRHGRTVNAARGTFSNLEADFAEWQISALRPLRNKCEQRVPLAPRSAAGIVRLLSCAATLLASQGIITHDVRLCELVSGENFKSWLDAFDGDEKPATASETIDSFTRVRGDIVKRDDIVTNMQVQRKGWRVANLLPEAAVTEVKAMLEEDRRIDLTPFALMCLATTDDLPAHTRLKLANVAPAMYASLRYALRASDAFALNHDDEFRLKSRASFEGVARRPLPHSPELASLFEQRAQIRSVLSAASTNLIMSNSEGLPMAAEACDRALSRTQRQFGMPSFCWHRLRDFAAVRMLRANPGALPVVADLLEYNDPALVYTRYAALLPRQTKNSSEVRTERHKPADEHAP